MYTYVLQDWITIRGSGTTAIVQSAANWLDLERFGDVVLYVSIQEVVNPGTGSVQIACETSPTPDDTVFQAMTTFAAAVNQTPAVAKILLGQDPPVPLGRFVRWKLYGTQSGTWDVTFRIVAVAGNLSSSFAPTSVNGCILWLRADRGVTLSGGAVSSWRDQSASGNDVSQSNGSQQPILTASNANFNGHPTITFNYAAFQHLDTANAVNLANGYTYFFVARWPSTRNYTGLFRFANTTNLETDSSVIAYQQASPNLLTGHNETTWYWQDNSTTTAGTTWTIMVANSGSQASHDVRRNGTSIVSLGTFSGGFVMPSTQKKILVGGGYGDPSSDFGGDLAEMIVFNNKLAAWDVASVESYLRGRYANY